MDTLSRISGSGLRRNLSLRSHLLLALVPGCFVASLEVLSVYQIYQLPDGLVRLVLPTYFALFGGFVQVPFVVARSRIVLRAFVLIASASLFGFLIDSLGGDIDRHWSSIMRWNYIYSAVSFGVLAVLLATLVCLAARLRMTLRLVALVGLAGVVTGVLMVYFVDNFLCIMWCDQRLNELLGIPLVIGPLLYSAAVYFGRENIRQECTI